MLKKKEDDVKKYLENCVYFMKNYKEKHSFYVSNIDDEKYEQLLIKLDSIRPEKDEILEIIEESIPQNSKPRGSPMLVGLGSFQLWSRDISASLQRGIQC